MLFFDIILFAVFVATSMAFIKMSDANYSRYLKILDKIDNCPVNNTYVMNEAVDFYKGARKSL